MWFMFVAMIVGIGAAVIVFKTSLWRGALGGLIIGVVTVFIVNVASRKPTECLNNSKGLGILWAYKLCPKL